MAGATAHRRKLRYKSGGAPLLPFPLPLPSLSLPLSYLSLTLSPLP